MSDAAEQDRKRPREECEADAKDAAAAKISRGICHIDIPVRDLSRAKKFYGDLFGWAFTDFGDTYSLFHTHNKEHNVNGGLTAVKEDVVTHSFSWIYLQVEDIEGELAKITAAGGEVIKPKSSIGESIGFTGQFKDSEGNNIGLYSLPIKAVGCVQQDAEKKE